MKCQYCNSEYDPANGPCPCTYQSGENYSYSQMGYRPPTAVELIKQVGCSTLFLVASILYTVFAGLELIYAQKLNVIGILTVIGLWMFYSECKKPSNNPYLMKTSSLSLLKAAQTVVCVVLWIGLVAMVLCLALFIFLAVSVGGQEPILDTLLLILTIVIVVVLALSVCELIVRKGIKRFIVSITESAETGLRPNNLSSSTPVFWMVMLSINAFLSLAIYVILFLGASALIEAIGTIPFSSLKQSGIDVSELEIYISLIRNMSTQGLISVFLPSFIISFLPYIPSFLFAKLMLDSKKLSDNSYYPTEEELFYQRQAFYEQYNQAYGYNQYQNQYTQGQAETQQRSNPFFTQEQYPQNDPQQYQQPDTTKKPPQDPPQE